MIFDYECEECKLVQEKWHKLNEENKEPCNQCGADSTRLKKLLGKPKPHISWSKWRV